MAQSIHLRILTPQGCTEATGSSAHLPLAENEKGAAGGDYNVHPGHTEAVFVLGKGTVTLLQGGTEVLASGIEEGIATFKDDELTVITQSAGAKGSSYE